MDRTAPILPMRPGLPEKATHDYVRHSTTTLFAALEFATGKITDACYPRHRHEEFLRLLKHVAKAYPRVKLHIVCDNYATHTHPPCRPGWHATRITMHFNPTSGSWLNVVEIFFGIITRQAIRRGTFTSVKHLIAAIKAFIDGWNERCEPFAWTKTADQILEKQPAVKGYRSRNTRTGKQQSWCEECSSEADMPTGLPGRRDFVRAFRVIVDSGQRAERVRTVLGDPGGWNHPGGYPDSLALCIIDSIQSIGVRYRSVQNVVERYRDFRRGRGGDPATDGSPELLATFRELDGAEAWAREIGNQNRTSTRSAAPLKALVIEQAACCATRMLTRLATSERWLLQEIPLGL